MTQMKRYRKTHPFLRIGLTCGLLLGGCASLSRPATRLGPEGYAHHKEDMSVVMHWNLTREDGRATAQGYVQSIAPATILLRLVHVTLVGYDAEGREVVRSHPVFSFPSTLDVEEPPWDQGTFEISMALEDAPATRFDLKVFYLWVPFSEDEPSRK